MKKLLAFLTIIGMFILVSCDDGIDTTIGPSDNEPSTTETSNGNSEETINESSETNEEPSTSEEKKDDNTSSGNVYDDGIDWGPLH